MPALPAPWLDAVFTVCQVAAPFAAVLVVWLGREGQGDRPVPWWAGLLLLSVWFGTLGGLRALRRLEHLPAYAPYLAGLSLGVIALCVAYVRFNEARSLLKDLREERRERGARGDGR